MNEKEREVLERLRQGAAPKPPAGLLERLKADVPERLPANVRPFRRRIPAVALRIAAALFVVSGAVLVVSRGVRRGVVPGVPEESLPRAVRQAEPSYPMAAPAAEAPRSPEPVDRDAMSRKPAKPAKPAVSAQSETKANAPPAKERGRRGSGDHEEDEQAGRAFAPPMPAPREREPEPAKTAPQAPEGRAAARADGPAPPRAVLGYSSASGAPAANGAVRQEEAGARDAKTESAPKLSAKKARASRGRAVAPTSGSLLADLFSSAPTAASMRSGDRQFLLLSVPRGEEAPLDPRAAVLSAAELRDGTLVVLASTPTSAGTVDEGSVSAPADLRLALLAHRLERANAAGDDAERAAVAREAREMAPRDPRAAALVRLASRDR